MLAKIWQLMNPQGLQHFEMPVFLMTMLMLTRAQQGVTLPDIIPVELRQSSEPIPQFN